MESQVSVQKVNNWLCRVVWDISRSKSDNGCYWTSKELPFLSYHCLSEIDLTSLGVDECYKIMCSMWVKCNYCGHGIPSLYLRLYTSQEYKEGFKQRKFAARYCGYEREMRCSPEREVFFSREQVNQLLTEQPVVCEVKKIWLAWEAAWTESIKMLGCTKYCSSQSETFEIFLEIDPAFSLEPEQGSGLRHLLHLWESKSFADITFRCENKDIKAHSVVVSSGSPVLAAMFQNDFKEKQENVVEIKETKAEVFEKLLFYIYTGTTDFMIAGFEAIAELMIAADMYKVISLKDGCELYLSEHITLENATTYLVFAHRHGAEKLFKATLNYIQQNCEAICARPDWKNLLRDHLDLGFDAIQFIVKTNEPKMK